MDFSLGRRMGLGHSSGTADHISNNGAPGTKVTIYIYCTDQRAASTFSSDSQQESGHHTANNLKKWSI